ncbi:hypothetical protein B0T26DRAFT_806425 [Lasiosphaeria miniovina]|uniref:Uncharacterized protein n=1 Tax=Lasiosphaeria miniovina TaxID=1954250 RepID=A0AA39ZZV7_9PEZI|nr:uncharacterized protein B0T26DRAFT_806425 [Lasiosphaeria miniovina]KAK0706706.1 hypothetical protein B0T26DRAFT_806425 [Lasiosphaeria miniovina]
MEVVRAALAEEDVVGRCRRPRRRRGQRSTPAGGLAGVEDWDVLGTAPQRAGPYFVVRSGTSQSGASRVVAGSPAEQGDTQ